ncbi:unnamed protein product [Amoebophrya sp. A120]|nr:unnamed protein product [Amoebophrya sp. A120]|eukprot:GSA120T00003619001.1
MFTHDRKFCIVKMRMSDRDELFLFDTGWENQGGFGERAAKKRADVVDRVMARNAAEDRRDVSKKRIRELFRLGERNTFKLASFFRKGLKGKEIAEVKLLDAPEELAYHKLRHKKDDMNRLKENQRKVETALKHMTANDRQLGISREALLKVVHEEEEEEEQKEDGKPIEQKRRPRKEQKTVSIDVKIEGLKQRYAVDNTTMLRQGRPGPEELPHFFERDRLVSEKEIEIRELAAEHNMAINDVDKIQVVFDFYDEDGSGEMEAEEFFQLLHVLTAGAEMTDKKRQEYWMQLDEDRSGSVNFGEFLLWYWRSFGAPTASSLQHSKRMMQAERDRVEAEAKAGAA